MAGYYVTLKYQAKSRNIAWKAFATLKWLGSTKRGFHLILLLELALIQLRYIVGWKKKRDVSKVQQKNTTTGE